MNPGAYIRNVAWVDQVGDIAEPDSLLLTSFGTAGGFKILVEVCGKINFFHFFFYKFS